MTGLFIVNYSVTIFAKLSGKKVRGQLVSLKYILIELTTDLVVHGRDIGSQKHGNRKAISKAIVSIESCQE